MFKRLIVVVALLVVAGCGGGGSDTDAKPSAKPTPTAFTTAQLEAAMPKRQDVPRALKVEPVCPEQKDRCDPDKHITVERTVDFDLPTDPSIDRQEADKGLQSVGASLSFGFATFDESASAAAAIAGFRAAKAKDDGPFTTKPQKMPSGGYNPAMSGTGAVDDVTIAGWKGTVASRNLVLAWPNGVKSHPILEVFLKVRRGATTLDATAVMHESGDKSAATDLAKQVAADYIERLGK